MTTLNDYILQVRALVHDLNSIDFSQAELIARINQARLRVALDLHCCRTFYDGLNLIPGQERYPITGCVAGGKLLQGGANYTNPMAVFVGGGGTGAEATVVQTNGVITSFQMTNWGQNYTSTPSCNIIDGDVRFVTNAQIRSALAALTSPLNAIVLVFNAIIALPVGNTVNIQWNSGAMTVPGDGLFNLISTACGLTAVQAVALYDAARNLGAPGGVVPFNAASGQLSAVQGGQTLISTISVSNQQFRLAAASPQYAFLAALVNAISSFPGDPANIIFNSGAPTVPGDALSLVLINSFGMTLAQVWDFYAFAATMPNSPQTVTNQQLRLALAAAGKLAPMLAALSASPSDPANIQWNSGAGSTAASADSLYTLISTVTPPAAIYSSAATFAANTPGQGALVALVTLRNVIDWDSWSVIWGTARPMLNWLPWPAFQAYARWNQSVPKGRPVMWTSFPENNYGMFYYIPDQTYSAELTALTLPDPLAAPTDVETQILPPNDDAVQWYAAHLCLLKLQQFGPADYYESKYMRRVVEINGTKTPVRYPNFYSSTGARISKWFGGGW